MRSLRLVLCLAILGGVSSAQPSPQKPAQPAPPKPASTTPATLPTEIPAKLTPTTEGMDYTRREVEIAMRDGGDLHTVILVPKGAKRAPMLLTRTPYDADDMTGKVDSVHLSMALDGYDHPVETIIEGGYIRVVQDVRGKHGSEGD